MLKTTFLLLFFGLLALPAWCQQPVREAGQILPDSLKPHQKTLKIGPSKPSTSENGTPLFILDGKPIEQKKLASIKPDSIQSMEVLKGEPAIARYGASGQYGVVIIRLKEEQSSE